MSCMKLRPMHCGAVVNNPWRQRAAMNTVLFGASVANKVIKNDMNMAQKRTGRRPNRCVNGTAMRPPTPSIYSEKSKTELTKTLPDNDRPTLSVEVGQYAAIGTTNGTPHAELKSGIIAQNEITKRTRCFLAQHHYYE
jgi:hypothetical protein